MHLLVDTEFTDFIDCDLISITLVADDGREFYGERSDYDDVSCTAFVREAVIPQLGRYPRRIFTREALRAALLAWMAQFESDQAHAVLRLCRRLGPFRGPRRRSAGRLDNLPYRQRA
jgi:hypothetical protein